MIERSVSDGGHVSIAKLADDVGDELRVEQRNVAATDVGSIYCGRKMLQSKGDSSQRAESFPRIVNDECFCGEKGQFLIWGGDNDDWGKLFAENPHHSLEAGFRAKGEQRLRLPHAATLAATEHNSATSITPRRRRFRL